VLGIVGVDGQGEQRLRGSPLLPTGASIPAHEEPLFAPLPIGAETVDPLAGGLKHMEVGLSE
jgi:hypothetical protein